MSFIKRYTRSSLIRPNCFSKGFTLLELLVSIAIFSLLIATVAYSFRFSTDIIKYLNLPYAEDIQRFTKLRDSLKSIFYYAGEKKNIYDKDRIFFYYFYGDNKEIKYITAKPVLQKSLAVARLYYDSGSLYLEEYPVYDRDNDYKNPQIPSNRIGERDLKTKIIDDIQDLQIYYYRDEKQIFNVNEEIPTIIKMKIRKSDKEQEFYFKIKSDFGIKKILSRDLYEPM